MKVLIIPDKFKGTLTAHAAAAAIARGWKRVRPKDQIISLPMSDGGDGFGKVMGDLIGAKQRTITAVDAAHLPCKAHWWWQRKTKTAVIESANVIGLAMLSHGKFHPFELDTFGLGIMLQRVLEAGAKRIVIGIGGSATNDGGFGMARALGWQYIDGGGRDITRWTDLHQLQNIRSPKVRTTNKSVEIIVASDVQNRLLGRHGSTRVYGPQKGLRARDFHKAERALQRLALVSRTFFKKNHAIVPGSGAAGGLGFGLSAFLSAKFRPGFDLLADLSNLTEHLRTVDFVITGEGRIDRSTSMGKGAGEIARRCRTLKLPCIVLAGSASDKPTLKSLFSQVYSLTDLTAAKSAKAKASHWLKRLAQCAARDMASARTAEL